MSQLGHWEVGVVKGTNVYGFEARYAIKHPTMHSTSLHNKVFGPNVNSFEVEKLV